MKAKRKNIFQKIRVAIRKKRDAEVYRKILLKMVGTPVMTVYHSQFALLQRYKNQKQGGQLYCVFMAQYS